MLLVFRSFFQQNRSVLLFQFLVLEPSISERSDANLQKIRIFQKSLEKQVLFLNYWHHRKSCYTCIFMVSLLDKSSLVYFTFLADLCFLKSKKALCLISCKPSYNFIFNPFVCRHFCQFHIFIIIFFVLFFWWPLHFRNFFVCLNGTYKRGIKINVLKISSYATTKKSS